MENSAAPAQLACADQIRRAVAQLQRQLRTLRANHGVSPGKLIVLSRLYRLARPITAVELARLERLQPQSLTRIIADLEARGLLARRQGDTDRRQILIEITKAGRDLLVQDARAQTAWLAERLGHGFNETELAVLGLAAPLLGRLGVE